MPRKNFIYVGGVPGAGKTTLCKCISERLEDYNYISSGGIKRPESRKRYGIGLSQLNQDKSFEINKWFFNRLFDMTSEGIYLVDTHYTYPLEDLTFVKLCPEEMAKRMNRFILIESFPQEIVRRRISRGRDRDSVNYFFTIKEIEEEKKEAIYLSNKFSIPLEILSNKGDLESASSNFFNILTL